jgi:hypothetical protein
VCQRVQPVAASKGVSSRESNLQFEGTSRSSIPARPTNFPQKRTRPSFKSYSHKLASDAPHAPTADCHSRSRLPRAVGHHGRAQQTRRSV